VWTSIEQKARLGFGLAVAVLLLVAGASYLNANKSVRTFQTVSHTQMVMEELASVLLATLDVETGDRGFVASGNESFLEPSESGQVRVKQSFVKLRALIAGDTEQQVRLDGLEALVTWKLAYCKDLVELRKTRGLEPAAHKLAEGEGKQVMDQIRQRVSAMKRIESVLLDARAAEAQDGARTTMLIVLAGALLSVSLVAVAGVLVNRGLTNRKRAEEERDRIWSLSRELLCIATFDGHFKDVNPAWNAALGLTTDELTTKPFIDFVHPEDRASTLAEAGKLMAGGETVHFENRYICKDGSYRWLAWSARSVAERRLMYASARDVTEERRAKDQIAALNADLQQRAAQLQAANKELEAFSYSVSHDLRAPLRHIDGYVARLVKATAEKLDEKSRRYLKIISEAAKEMGQLIDDLLDFSRAGRQEMQNGVVELRELAQEVIGSLGAETQGRNIRWKNGELPVIAGDAVMLRQVMINLLSNAVKYTRPRDPAEIEIGCASQTDQEVVVFIRDNGVGFEMEYVDKLFGVFQRLHRANEFEGTGVGLANVRRIVERHGGRTWAEGAVDRGATFYFSLPKEQKGST